MKLLKRVTIALSVLLVVFLGVAAWFMWTSHVRLEQRLAAIRAAGDPVVLADLAREPIVAERNADTYLRRAQANAIAIAEDVEKSSEACDYFYPPPISYTNSVITFPMPAKVRLVVKAAFDAHPNVVGLLKQAAECPDYDAKLDYTLPAERFMTSGLNWVQENRNFARVLNFDARLLIAEGKRDDAVGSCLALLKLARLFDRNPTLVSYLLALTCRFIALDAANVAMQAGPISEDVRRTLDAELAVQDRMEGYVGALKTERALGSDLIDAEANANRSAFALSYWNREKAAYLDLMQDCVASAIEDLASQDGEKNALMRGPGVWAGEGMVAQLSLPSIEVVHQSVKRTQVLIRCLRVLSALQSRDPAGSNRTPQLQELGLPAAATIDSFSGGLLLVKKTARGWLVYSVGQNLKDDGGKIEDPTDGDIGLGPPPVAKADEQVKK